MLLILVFKHYTANSAEKFYFGHLLVLFSTPITNGISYCCRWYCQRMILNDVPEKHLKMTWSKLTKDWVSQKYSQTEHFQERLFLTSFSEPQSSVQEVIWYPGRQKLRGGRLHTVPWVLRSGLFCGCACITVERCPVPQFTPWQKSGVWGFILYLAQENYFEWFVANAN